MIARWCGAVAVLACLWVVSPAHSQTVEVITDAAQSGEADAQYALGLRYFEGDGVAEDYAQSADWFARASIQGHSAAQNHLGRYYFAGLGVAQDRKNAIALLEQAAKSGEPAYVFDLAKALETDATTLPRAAALYDQAAQAGHQESLVSLGVLYQDGRGVTQDFARAIALYEGPAQAGHPRALNNLGLMYVRGTGVAQDYARAAELFGVAAEAGLQTAMTNLGVLFENGFGVPLDEARAAELYRLGGRGDVAVTSTSVEMLYDQRLHPVDTSPDSLAAIETLARAGDPVAQFQFGWTLMQTPEPDFETYRQAAAFFTAGAQGGHGPSMANLGVMYFRGQGLPQDYVLGQMWLLRARAAGVQEANALNDVLAGAMTAAQINESQKLANVVAKPD